MHVQVLAYDGFRERDAFGAMEVLYLAATTGAEVRVELVRVGSATVTSAYGLHLHVPGHLDPARPPTLLILPGSGWSAHAPEDRTADPQWQRVARILADTPRTSTTIGAIGSGALLLAHAGLLARRAITCPGSLADGLRSVGAEIIQARVVDDGDIVTAVGATAGLDLALWLVDRFVSPVAAHQVELRLGHERRGTVWRRGG